jgi:hypothetical protein
LKNHDSFSKLLRPILGFLRSSDARVASGDRPAPPGYLDKLNRHRRKGGRAFPEGKALDRQRRRSRQAANFVRPHTENVAAQRTAGTPNAALTGRTIAPTASIQTH